MENKSISKAFVAAQKAFGPALKTATNPHFRSRYADLSACVEAVLDALHANGIALQQRTSPSADGVTVETVFIHESGETMSCGQLHVPAAKHDAQGYGSAMTYARRYSLMAACGIAPEDDDGNAAVRAKPAVKVEAAPAKLEQWTAAINALQTADELKEFYKQLNEAERKECADLIRAAKQKLSST